MSQHNRFKRIAGAFFRVSDEGLKAVSDPKTLRGLLSGDIKSSSEPVISGGADRFASTTTNPVGTVPAGSVATIPPPAGTISPTDTTAPFQPQGATTGTTAPPAANVATTTDTATPTAPNASDNFNLLLTKMLSDSQGIDNTELLKRRRVLQLAAAGRAQEITPEELRTLSPAQQNAIRNADIRALEPELTKASADINEAEQRTRNFEALFLEAQKIGGEFAEKMVAPDNVIDSYVKLIESGLPLSTILAGVNDKTRNAVFANLDPLKIQQKDKAGFTLGTGQQRFDAAGNLIATGADKPETEADFTLGAGQIRFDDSGKVIARGEKVPVDRTAPIGGGVAPTDTPTGISPVTGKVFTQSQSQVATFASRMQQAEELLGDDEVRVFSSTVGGLLPGRFKSDARKEFEQVEVNFITAVLRRESGAAISSEEFKDARSVYIPQVGDGEDVLAQKKLARKTVLQGFINESVGAFEQLQSSLGRASSLGRTTLSGNTFTSSSGNTYNLPN